MRRLFREMPRSRSLAGLGNRRISIHLQSHEREGGILEAAATMPEFPKHALPGSAEWERGQVGVKRGAGSRCRRPAWKEY